MIVSQEWPNAESSSSISSTTLSIKSMKSCFSSLDSFFFTRCSSTQLDAKESKSLAILFMDLRTFPSNGNHPKMGIKSEGTNSPEICIKSLINFTTLRASSSSTSCKLPKYLFPAIILVIIFTVNLSNHSLITIFGLGPVLWRVGDEEKERSKFNRFWTIS